MQVNKNKMRVYEVAKKLGIKSPKLIKILGELGVDVKGHLSSLEPDAIFLAEEYVKEMHKKQEVTEKKSQKISGDINVGEFAKRFKVPIRTVKERIMKLGIPYKPDRRLSKTEVHYLASELNFDVPEFKDKEFLKQLCSRAPVVTVMGHVDHGKTTLLDTIRKTSIAAQEKGKITQAIGASVVNVNGKEIIFIDTPGHEAFTEMRLRGSLVTDIVILVVAADEGVKDQTIESLDHARAADVPIIVALNKIDRPNADPEAVKKQLADRGLLPEDWGGSTIYANVSAKTGKGVGELLEMINLQAELLELKTNPTTLCSGTVIESEMHKNIGPLATVVVQTGTLKASNYIRVGDVVGRVRFLTDIRGKMVKKIKAVSVVGIVGLPSVPKAGEIFYVIDNIKDAKEETKQIEIGIRNQQMKTQTVSKTMDDLFREMEEKELKKLFVILKADTQGSLEAVKHAVKELKSPVPIDIIHEGVGGIVKSDILLAEATKAVILGFSVRPTTEAKKDAKARKVEIMTYDVIFELMDDIERLLKGMVKLEVKEVVVGRATVKQVFKVSGTGTIAGCIISEGKIVRDAKAKVLRDNAVIYDTVISSLKRFKKDVKEVAKGYECGIGLKNFNDIKVGDEIEISKSSESETK
ncbi:MAG: translation initiation factor IF-2 [Caldisericaceae bacterium]|nr:translation initiation factor IF-2 [Caldisericaceae bacterium]